MLTCAICPGRSFGTSEALRNHKIDSRGHYYCQSCATDLPDQNALFEHATIVHATTCEDCRRMFSSVDGLNSHRFDSPKHPKCRPCRMGFRDRAALASHKAEVHDSEGPSRRNSRRTTTRTRNGKPFSYFPNANGSLTSSPTLRAQSPSLSTTTRNSRREDAAQKMLPHSRNVGEVESHRTASPQRSAEVHRPNESPRISAVEPEKDGLSSGYYFPCSSSLKKPARCDDHGTMPSPCLKSESASDRLRISAELTESYESDGSPQDELSDFAGEKTSFSSPLLDACVPLPSDSGSDESNDRESGRRRHAGEWTLPRSSSPQLHQDAGGPHCDSSLMTSSSRDRLASQTLRHCERRLSDAMWAAWRIRCAAEAGPASPRRLGSPSSLNTTRTFSQVSRLPTISDESEHDQESELEYDSESLVPLIADTLSEVQQQKRPVVRRRRRLSLSPTLPSIPEAAQNRGLEAISPVDLCDSESDSSHGIFEHYAEDFLYDSMSENERCQTPLTYLTADELEFDLEEGIGSCNNEQRDLAKRFSDFPSPPTLLAEDLTKIAMEMCSPSPQGSDYDQSADPFELHPSANNSPMKATFPRRRRAWSVGPPEKTDSGFLVPVTPRPGIEEPTSKEECEEREDTAVDESKPGVEELDEAAIAADEPPPTDIEDDLFSEPDEVLEPIRVIGHADAQFAEEGHPLQSLITLNTLSLDPKAHETIHAMSLSPFRPVQQDEPIAAVALEPDGRETTSGQKSLLYCRVCLSDPCREATATFCGHVFCNGCITREVMDTSKCPVCKSPTLLYCLFKLDLGC